MISTATSCIRRFSPNSSKFEREYGDVSVLPTPAFFYGLKPGEEISVNIEEGKTLFIKLINIGVPTRMGNGLSPTNSTASRARAPSRPFSQAKSRPASKPTRRRRAGRRADPGMITGLHATVGGKVAKGDKLITLEAMKMQTTLYAPAGWNRGGDSCEGR